VLDFIAGNNHFYLNFSMAAAKVALMAGSNVPNSSLVTVMARNGVEFGIQMSGTGNQWFTGTAQMVKGLYFPGFGEDDAAPDLGDSAITETMGIGGFAMAAAPGIVQFVGEPQRQPSNTPGRCTRSRWDEIPHTHSRRLDSSAHQPGSMFGLSPTRTSCRSSIQASPTRMPGLAKSVPALSLHRSSALRPLWPHSPISLFPRNSLFIFNTRSPSCKRKFFEFQ
jgi:hypothetical protein